MDCLHTVVEKDRFSLTHGYCPLCLRAEVERLKAHLDATTANWNLVISERDKLREALGKTLRLLKRNSYHEALVMVGDTIDNEALKDSEPEPERWGCCGAERNEIHGDYCPRCS